MVKIIETNINQEDFQSRVIEYVSWEDFVNIFKNYDSNKKYTACSCDSLDYHGVVIHTNSVITNLKYDEFHLSCDIAHNGFIDKKMAYLIK